MRTWRVGSISMGVSLLILGVLLLLTQILKMNTATILLAWWPVILIILGAEILLYLCFSKLEKPNVKYDFLSIFFVGLIGMIGIGLTVLTTSGILDKVNEWTSIETSIMNLPEYEKTVGEDIKRVVVNTASHYLTIEDSPDADVSIFGTYRAQTLGDEVAIHSVEDYMFTTKKGDTLYVTFKDIYNLPQPFQDRIDLNATLLIPSDINLEVNGEYNAVTLIQRNPLKAWVVNQVLSVDVQIAKEADMLIKAKNVDDLTGEGWDDNNHLEKTGENGSFSTMKIGAGTHSLSINDAHSVAVTKR